MEIDDLVVFFLTTIYYNIEEELRPEYNIDFGEDRGVEILKAAVVEAKEGKGNLMNTITNDQEETPSYTTQTPTVYGVYKQPESIISVYSSTRETPFRIPESKTETFPDCPKETPYCFDQLLQDL